MWRRDDPGYPPSPDPAAEAERHYANLARYDEPDDERCDEDCPGFYVHVNTRDGSHVTYPCVCAAPWPSWRWPQSHSIEDNEEVPF